MFSRMIISCFLGLSVKTKTTRDMPIGEQKQNRVLRPHSTPATLMWLEENYEVAEGVCIPRSTLYMHYVDFCAKNSMQPVNAASFGKIIRQQFPQLTTRRLGTRGQSRYHYYGIAVKETSLYFQLSYSKKGTTSGNDMQREINKQTPLYSPRSRVGTVLPDFPTVKELNLPSSVDVEKVTTFLMMYRTHCQRLLDTLIRSSFNEVQSFLLHFWQGIPPHLSPLFETNVLVNLVGICDSILYKAISSVLLPTVLQTLPDSLTKLIRRFVQELEGWLKMALANLPEGLRNIKLEMAKRFIQVLRRQMSLNHLTQASRMVVHNSDVIAQMLHDWRQIDIDAICRETLYSMEQEHNGITCQFIRKFSNEFETLLEDEAPLEAYTEWLEALVNKCIFLPGMTPTSIRRLSSQFLLMWSAFGTRIIRDMTLHSAASFGSFHLLRLMFDDYVLFLVETIHIEEQVKEFLRNISNDAPPQIPDAYLGGSEYNQVPFGLDAPYNSREQYTDISTVPNQDLPMSTAVPRRISPGDDRVANNFWMSTDYSQSYSQDDGRQTWTQPTICSRQENAIHHQYLVGNQEEASSESTLDPGNETCRTAGDNEYHYYNIPHQQEEGGSFHADIPTGSISYTTNYHTFNQLQGQYRQRSTELPRHHQPSRSDVIYCDS